jgi:two-component system, NarL family, response regulator DesR
MTISGVRPIRLVFVDDSAELRSAWVRLLERVPDIDLLLAIGDAPDLEAEVRRLTPDVVVLDLNVGRQPMDQLITRLTPWTRVLVYSGRGDAATIDRVERAGAIGFVGKHEEPLQLINAIRISASGSRRFPSRKV